MLNALFFEVHKAIGLKNYIVEHQVNVEVPSTKRDVILPAHKCKAFAQFQHEHTEITGKGVLQCILVPGGEFRQAGEFKADISMSDKYESDIPELHVDKENRDTLIITDFDGEKKIMMKAVADAVTNMTQAQISELEAKGQITLQADGQDALIELEDVDIMSQDIPGWSVANEGTMTVALDIIVTPELKVEGNARKIIKQIQNIRKSSGFEITDRITVQISDCPEVRDVLAGFKQNIASQVLANSIDIADNDGELIQFEEFKANIKVVKA